MYEDSYLEQMYEERYSLPSEYEDCDLGYDSLENTCLPNEEEECDCEADCEDCMIENDMWQGE